MSIGINKFISNCLKVNLEERLTIKKLLTDEWVKKTIR